MPKLISVIVPIYNVKKYINRCVKSIINQTYTNLEIILVDDGSVDGGSLICDKWQKEDLRIKIVHKTNGGLSDARNVGMSIATGDYFAFIDGDDEIDYQMLEKLYNAITDTGADLSMCRMEKIENNRRYPTREYPIDKTQLELTGMEAIRLLLHEKVDCSACLKLYKKELFQEIKFPYGKTNEDFAVMYKLFHQCRKITYISDILYYYYYRENSITTSEFSEKQFDKYDNCLEMMNYVKKYLPVLLSDAYFYLYQQTLYLIKTLCVRKLREEYKERYIQMNNTLKRGTCYIAMSKDWGIKQKLMILCIVWTPRLYTKIHRE